MSADKQTRHNKTRQPRSDFQRLSRRFMSGLLRSLFLINKPTRAGQAGFVLPTTVLLLLMVTLTVGAMSYRTFSRTEQTIAYRNQQVIDSIAAPAIDRAKAKIEFLFTEDALVADKKPPSSGDLLTALSGGDVYTLAEDETRIDINGDKILDNAWRFQAEDKTEIVYSIILDDSDDTGTISLSSPDNKAKAANLIVRNGPIDTTTPTGSCPIERLAGNGWQLSGARLAKNIQVNVLAIKGKGTPTETVSAAEYQQVRTATRGNRWGAWFRYDLDATPGEPFRWNGAMHSEGNLIANSGFIAYMVSSPDSCIYDDTASVIEIKGDENSPFLGQLISGSIVDNKFDKGAIFHTAATASDKAHDYINAGDTLKADRDTIKNATTVAEIFQDPVKIFTEDSFAHVDSSTWSRDTAEWNPDANKYGIGRVRNDTSEAARPFLDDGYRADNRYGPKPTYNKDNTLTKAGKKSGDDIAAAETVLVNNTVGTEELGLDGYWERSAVSKGLRVVVGQRLELGNTFGWRGNLDPLYPPDSGTFDVMKDNDLLSTPLKGINEALQMRSLRDNLAAVQSMAVYHYSDAGTAGTYPLACIASVAHPGTLDTIKNSRTFNKYKNLDQWETDFFTGRGTNGIVFTPPTNLYAGSTKNTYGALNPDWDKALNNLAKFAGDPYGGAPSFPAVQKKVGDTDAFVHPYPYMSMWGDFSILRRIFKTYSASDALSVADQSTIHTAACTLGMLAYNMDAVEKEYAKIPAADLNLLGNKLADLMSTGYNTLTTSQWLAKLAESIGVTDAMKENALIVAKKMQIERDRTFGFIPVSPTAKGLPGTGYDADSRRYNTTSGNNISSFSPSPAGQYNVGCDPTAFSSTGPIPILNKAQVGLAVAFCSVAQGPKYPSLYYLFPKANHSQGNVSGEDFFTNGNSYTTRTDVNGTGDSTYQTFDPAVVALSPPRTPSDTAWKMPKEAITVTGSSIVAGKPNFNSFDAPDAAPKTSYAYLSPGVFTVPSEEDKSLSTNIIAVQDGTGGSKSYKFYKTAFLDTAIMDGRELMNVRLMNLDVNLLTKNKVNGSKPWIPDDSGIVYAFREDAVREDAIVRPYSGSLDSDAKKAWDACKTVATLTTGNCPMSLDPRKNPHDPPLNNATGISPKPVDMYPDPDRRPHGFRFVNGKSFNRPDVLEANPPPAGMTFISDNTVYIKGDFNLHAVKGASNLEANLIEEFKGTSSLGTNNVLGTAFASETDEQKARKIFYGRERNKLDSRFADKNKDNWRPVEIFADAITILSDTFIDGAAIDYYTVPTRESIGKPRQNSSYLNANRPQIPGSTAKKDKHSSASWFHEADSSRSITAFSSSTFPFERKETPIVVGRNGQIYKTKDFIPPFLTFPKDISDTDRNISFYVKTDPSKFFYQLRQFQQAAPRRTAAGEDAAPEEAPVRINALLIAGIVPARKGQAYGGIHNFPRLLEYWSGKSGEENRPLVISGGFFQLNFSSQAVAPFDQDAWEPGAVPYVGTETRITVDGKETGNQYLSNFYYGPPQRIWGYDPALQYSPSGPIAQRFARVDRPRSEYYRELSVDDEYIKNLKKCIDTPGDCNHP